MTSTQSKSKDSVIGDIVSLMTAHDIDIDEISVRLTHDKTPSQQNNIVKTLLGYTGGILVFSGIGLLIGMLWDDMSSAQRVISTLGTGLVAFVLGIVAHKDVRFVKGATPLLLVAGLMQPTGMFVFLGEYYPDGGDVQLAAIMIFSVMVIQMMVTFVVIRRPSLLFMALIYWSGLTALIMNRADVDGELAGMCLGLSLLLLTYQIDNSKHRAIVPFWYFVGGGIFLCSVWDMLDGTVLDMLYLAVNSFFVYLSIRLASRSLLFVSVIGLLGYLSYFTAEYFADVIGWPVALIVMGLVLIGLSAYAVKLGQEIKTAQR